MISNTPEVEINVYCDGPDRSYFVSGVNGRFDRILFEQFEVELEEESAHREIEELVTGLGMDHGHVTILAELIEVELEIQEGTGYGFMHKLQGYYYISKMEVTSYKETERPKGETA